MPLHGSTAPELLATAAQAAKVEGRRGRAVSEREEGPQVGEGEWESGDGCCRLSILRKTSSV